MKAIHEVYSAAEDKQAFRSLLKKLASSLPSESPAFEVHLTSKLKRCSLATFGTPQKGFSQ